MSTSNATFPASPADALAAWPAHAPLAALWSGGGHANARWTILAKPSRVVTLSAADAHRAGELTTTPRTASDAPFAHGWMLCASYELGHALEPAAGPRTSPWPALTLLRCDDAWTFDHHRAAWHAVGAPPTLSLQHTPTWHAGTPTSNTGEREYMRRVASAVEYIRAGDIYQVNLAHRLCAPFTGSARALFQRWASRTAPWYGAYLEWDEPATRRAVLSASPELFLAFDPATRRLSTRPMKGTRPAHHNTHDLAHAPKDRAELTMIVDLMRNDLGRVCDLASVRVDTPRTIETHPGLAVHQATATISGTLAQGLSWWDALSATFPGGSITGAPKVRAMQVINELEPTSRGPYCGCIGFLSDSGAFHLNIAIRTALLEGTPAPASLGSFANATLSYSVGAGIVADSDPHAEWRETLDKAAAFLSCIPPRCPDA